MNYSVILPLLHKCLIFRIKESLIDQQNKNTELQDFFIDKYYPIIIKDSKSINKSINHTMCCDWCDTGSRIPVLHTLFNPFSPGIFLNVLGGLDAPSGDVQNVLFNAACHSTYTFPEAWMRLIR